MVYDYSLYVHTMIDCLLCVPQYSYSSYEEYIIIN